MCCSVAAKSSYRHASKMPHPLRQIGLSYRGFVELWSAFGSFQPFITNDTVESSNRSEEHTSELQSLMRISYAVFCLKKTKHTTHYLQHILDANDTEQ